MNTEDLKSKFAFYGSLREGHYNWARLVKPSSGLMFDGTIILKGYKLFDTGMGYPFATKTENPADTLVVELYDIPDKRYASSIHHMESGAGYRVEEIEHNGVNYQLYIKEKSSYGTEVKSGDWTEHVTENQT